MSTPRPRVSAIQPKACPSSVAGATCGVRVILFVWPMLICSAPMYATVGQSSRAERLLSQTFHQSPPRPPGEACVADRPQPLHTIALGPWVALSRRGTGLGLLQFARLPSSILERPGLQCHLTTSTQFRVLFGLVSTTAPAWHRPRSCSGLSANLRTDPSGLGCGVTYSPNTKGHRPK
jgi:hypothetical protein